MNFPSFSGFDGILSGIALWSQKLIVGFKTLITNFLPGMNADIILVIVSVLVGWLLSNRNGFLNTSLKLAIMLSLLFFLVLKFAGGAS